MIIFSCTQNSLPQIGWRRHRQWDWEFREKKIAEFYFLIFYFFSIVGQMNSVAHMLITSQCSVVKSFYTSWIYEPNNIAKNERKNKKKNKKQICDPLKNTHRTFSHWIFIESVELFWSITEQVKKRLRSSKHKMNNE